MSDTLVSTDSRPRSELRPSGTSFAGLVGVELRRLWWRRLTKAVIAGVVLFVVAMVYNAYNSSTPERLAQQLDNYKIMLEDSKRQAEQTKEQLPQMIKDCQDAQQQERDRSGDQSLDFGCSTMGEVHTPTMEDMGIVVPVAETITVSAMPPLAAVLTFLLLLLMGSFVAAEFTTGSMGNWLTFKPRRMQVAASKVVAAGIGAVAIGSVAVGLLVVGARMVATINRPGSDLQLPEPPSPGEPLGQLAVRAVLVALFAGVVGAALGLLIRHTAAVIGTLLGYLVLVEGVAVHTLFQGNLVPWAVVPNLNAFLEKGYVYPAETCTADRCTYAEQTLSYTHGWVYLLVLGSLVLAAAVVAFRRRDVT
jgi:ABC-2 type transport system permease protein